MGYIYDHIHIFINPNNNFYFIGWLFSTDSQNEPLHLMWLPIQRIPVESWSRPPFPGGCSESNIKQVSSFDKATKPFWTSFKAASNKIAMELDLFAVVFLNSSIILSFWDYSINWDDNQKEDGKELFSLHDF